MKLPVSPEDVDRAAKRIAGIARRTPLMRHDALDERAGAKILIKPECLQVTGSFKIRGAANRIAQTTASQRRAGVVAFSSGNHAQGVARAARLFGCPATIVMPKDAPKVKVEGVERDGATIVFYDRNTESREEIASELSQASGAVLVPSFDDPDIVAGQGTCGLEIGEQANDAGLQVDHFLSCTGGGGLISGSALGLGQTFPNVKSWTVEPSGHDDWLHSLAQRQVVPNAPGVRSICDAILTPKPGDIPFLIALEQVSGGLVVTDHEVKVAMRFAFRHLKLVLEPGGAVALAAVLRGVPQHMQGQTCAIVLSGGNVDPSMFAEILLDA